MKETFLERLKRELTREGDSSIVSFRALEDLSLGDVSTDHFIRLGGDLKRDPGGLAKEAVERLSPALAVRLSVEQGFLNVRLPEEDLAEIDSSLSTPGPVHEIIVPPRSRSLDRLVHLRLFSIAALQAFTLASLGRRVLLEVGDRHFDGDCRSLAALVRFGSTSPESPAWSPSPRLEGDDSSATVWLAPDQLTPGSVSEFFSRSSSLRDRVRFRAPPAFWLRTREESDEVPRIESWNDAELASLVLLLASPESADELDLAVPRSNEGANLPWFAATLLDRAERLSREQPFEGTSAEECSESRRHLLARLALYPSHVAQCAAFGDAVALVTVTADLLNRTSRLINDPALRLRHARQALGSWEAQLLRRYLEISATDPFLSRIVSIGTSR